MEFETQSVVLEKMIRMDFRSLTKEEENLSGKRKRGSNLVTSKEVISYFGRWGLGLVYLQMKDQVSIEDRKSSTRIPRWNI